MKILFITFAIYFSSIQMQSQNLSIDELSSLRKKSFGNLEEVLSIKNWSFLKGDEETTEKMGTATFTFNKMEYNDEASAFLEFYYDNSENEKLCNHKINLQFFDKAKYNNYVIRLKSLGCKLIKSKIEDGNIVKIYQGSTTTFQISIVSEKDLLGTTNTTYNLFIMDNVDYFINYDEDSTLRDLLKERIENEKK
ncbi:hypothetical protein SL054_002488 [Flavobacterium psychrophilum]|uniref:Uncharacterized protein n=1 Tax=Flavobacterium psychrophilum TaxID=96345 RepID=A0A7U2NGH3_FLAPS|nr:hypothetical protein [Flavobacterium psychrophilum]EKT4499983.1 hypothetical protein [Flavobacterium psychrophilum]EKT4550773.1 hypothetical protein [Flavobacterium psychrophilum]EKT4553239.1 hypothetical protein [Flavobacterium psychrophilum]ELM3645100.1 hypothetical protein [Flavobacterium psychrophilum]ELM3651556.1 hypothetical protein [Flavobacterium psychrophilum]